MSLKNIDPAAMISSLFRTDFNDDSGKASTSKKNYSYPDQQPRKNSRRAKHEEYRTLLEEGKLHLEHMDNAETFLRWVMDGTKRIAIYCKVCDKFLGPSKGGSFFVHVRACKRTLYPDIPYPAAPVSKQQKEEFSFTVADAIGKESDILSQLNTNAFKQCIQKALTIGFESKQPGYDPPDAAELFKNDSKGTVINESSETTFEAEESSNDSDNILLKNNMFNAFIKHEESTISDSPIEMDIIPSDRRASTLGEEIFNANEYTDVIFNTADGKQISAHRCFLSRASPVFKKLFEKNATNSSKIDIEFDESITLKAIQFCYGNYFVIDGYEKQLLEFANVYQIQELKESCLSHFYDTVTPFNVCQIIEIAYEIDDECLKKICLQTIVKNKAAVGKENINNLPPSILCDILFSQ